MIDEKKLTKLRKYLDESLACGTTHIGVAKDSLIEIVDTLEALWKEKHDLEDIIAVMSAEIGRLKKTDGEKFTERDRAIAGLSKENAELKAEDLVSRQAIRDARILAAKRSIRIKNLEVVARAAAEIVPCMTKGKCEGQHINDLNVALAALKEKS